MKRASKRVAEQTGNNYYGVGGFTSIKAFFANYVNFTGRSSRREYWWLMLFSAIVGIVLGGVTVTATAVAITKLVNAGETDKLTSPFGILVSVLWLAIVWLIIGLATLVPSLALAIRRFRDAGVHWGVYVVLYVAQWFVYVALMHQETLRMVLTLVIAIIVFVITVLPTKNPPLDEGASDEAGE